ncbi:MAG TPA: ATP-binding protein [Candidatus Angelobacter sp.]|nr:ATP-binding protein [Candidatus Angelobacter sp.]
MPGSCTFEADKLLIKLDITFKADIDEVSPVVDSVLETAGRMGCGKGHEMEIEIALREALVNAIKHGAGGDPSKEVRCCVACDESRGMLIVVSDPGKGFDPKTVPSPLVGEQLFSDHGRGLYLINQLMDQVWFSDGGTQIHMVKAARGENAGRPG